MHKRKLGQTGLEVSSPRLGLHGLRANALENNVSPYNTERGSRKTLAYADARVTRRTWHTLKVEFAGTRIGVSLDGKRYIDFDDKHITGSGAVGVWTKADSVTVFDDFIYAVIDQ